MSQKTILFDIAHPATVHLFRNAIDELQKRGHHVVVTSREKDVTTDLLDTYGIEHETLSKSPQTPYRLPSEWGMREIRMIRIARKMKPDVIVSETSPPAAHAAALVGSTAVQFSDTDTASHLIRKLTYRFVDRIYTPMCYGRDLGPKQRRYHGYHELAYLHPDRFSPDQHVTDQIDTPRDGPLIVMRLVSWGAHHDIGENGLTDPVKLVRTLEARGANVVVSAENGCPPAIVDRAYDLPPHRIHDLLSAADLFVGESATMATESAVLGTPAVYLATIKPGYLKDIERRYSLIHNVETVGNTDERVINRIVRLLEDDRTEWKRRRELLLAENVETTDVILNAILEHDTKTEYLASQNR